MKRNNVTWLHCPLKDLILVSIGINIRQDLILIVFKQRRFIKSFRSEPFIPTMRPGHKLNRSGLINLVQSEPKTTILFSIDTVVRLIMMPWGGNIGIGFLNKHMFME